MVRISFAGLGICKCVNQGCGLGLETVSRTNNVSVSSRSWPKTFRRLVSVSGYFMSLVETSAWNGYLGTRFNTRYPGTRQIPGYPGITQYPCYFFHKVRDTLFLSDNLNTTARAVDALHLYHKAGIQGWVPFPGVAACAMCASHV